MGWWKHPGFYHYYECIQFQHKFLAIIKFYIPDDVYWLDNFGIGHNHNESEAVQH